MVNKNGEIEYDVNDVIQNLINANGQLPYDNAELRAVIKKLTTPEAQDQPEAEQKPTKVQK